MRLREIERLRGIAVLIVMLGHMPALRFTAGAIPGSAGVDLFFVISGFVVASAFERLAAEPCTPLTSLGRYYIRRLFRIAPMAVVSAGLAYLAARFINEHQSWSDPATVAREISYAFTLRYNFNIQSSGIDLGYFWSLNVEEHFYLVFPLLWLALRSKRVRAHAPKIVAALVLVATALRVLRPFEFCNLAMEDYYPWTRTIQTPYRCDGLLLGVLLLLTRSSWAPRLARIPRTLCSAIALLLLAAILASGQLPNRLDWEPLLVACCGFGLVALASLDRGTVLGRGHLLSRFLEYVGARSYALYLLHLPCWLITFELFSSRGDLATYAITYLGTFCLAELAHRLIERPFIKMGYRLSGRDDRNAARKRQPCRPLDLNVDKLAS